MSERTINIVSHTFSESGFGSSLAGGSSSGSHDFAVKLSAEVQPSKGLTGLEGPFPRSPLSWLEVGAGSWQEASVPCHISVSIELFECPNNMAVGFPHKEGSKGQQDRSHMCLKSLKSHTLSLPPHLVL